MGIQASTNKSSTTNNITSNSFNRCGTNTADNTINLYDVQFRPDLNPACGSDSVATFSQTAGVDATCTIKSLQDSISKIVAQENAKTKGGFGFQGSTNVNDINNQITQTLKNSCGNKSSTNTANVKDTIITSCQWHFAQNATDKSSCEINAVQKIANDVQTKLISSASGASIWGLLFGGGKKWIWIILGVLLLLLILGLIAYFIYHHSQHKGQMVGVPGFSSSAEEAVGAVEANPEILAAVGGASKFLNYFNDPKTFYSNVRKNKGLLTLLILGLLALVFILFFSTKNDEQLTKDDISNFKKSYAELQKIAGLKSPTASDSSNLTDSLSVPHSPNHPSTIRLPSDHAVRVPLPPELSDYDEMSIGYAYDGNTQYHNNLNDYYQPLL